MQRERADLAGRSQEFRPVECSVPHARNLYQFSLDIEAIDNPIWAKDNLADSSTAVFRNDTTRLGMFLQNVCSSHQFICERLCAWNIVARNEANDVAQIVT